MARGVYVTTMVFNRHDLLKELFASLAASSRRPDGVYVVDHAYDAKLVYDLDGALDGIPLEVVTLDDCGCAHAANWLLRNVPDDRVGCGDDVTFDTDAIGLLCDTAGDFIIPDHALSPLNPGACCVIRNSCVDKVGWFDERLSPQFLYFEDTDFIRRMQLAGVPQTTAKGAIVHHHEGGSQTMQRYTAAQMDEHHRRFRIASANYSYKWGGPPFHETLTTPRELPR